MHVQKNEQNKQNQPQYTTVKAEKLLFGKRNTKKQLTTNNKNHSIDKQTKKAANQLSEINVNN